MDTYALGLIALSENSPYPPFVKRGDTSLPPFVKGDRGGIFTQLRLYNIRLNVTSISQWSGGYHVYTSFDLG